MLSIQESECGMTSDSNRQHAIFQNRQLKFESSQLTFDISFKLRQVKCREIKPCDFYNSPYLQYPYNIPPVTFLKYISVLLFLLKQEFSYFQRKTGIKEQYSVHSKILDKTLVKLQAVSNYFY